MLLLTDFDIKERFTDLNLQTDSPFVRCIYVPDKYRPTEAETLKFYYFVSLNPI